MYKSVNRKSHHILLTKIYEKNLIFKLQGSKSTIKLLQNYLVNHILIKYITRNL